MMIANARIPYNSTFVQTMDDEEPEFDQVFEDVQFDKDAKSDVPEKMSMPASIPLSTHLIQTRDDDPSKMEGMLMEDPNIPLNLRLVHIETEEGDELIKIY